MEGGIRGEQVQSVGEALRGNAEDDRGGRGTLGDGRRAVGGGRATRRALMLLALGIAALSSTAPSRPSPIAHPPSQSDAPSRIDRGRFTAVFYPSESTL